MTRKFRTAVLCVHGIGNQRAQETVRGIVDAVWFDDDNTLKKKVWTHPERSVDDIDLVVMTTSETDAPDKRSVDFHELYWAHLMSETRAIAVLLWLLELVRKGPLLRRGLRAVWYAGAVFLCLLTASVVLISIKAIELFANVSHEPQALMLAPLFVLFTIVTCSLLFAVLGRASKLIFLCSVLAALIYFLFVHGISGDDIRVTDIIGDYIVVGNTRRIAELFFVPVTALVVAGIIMGRRGLLVMAASYILGQVFFFLFYLNGRYLLDWDRANPLVDLWKHFPEVLDHQWNPFGRVLYERWILFSLTENWSTVIACVAVLLYLALNALFLQSYLGDAARYFRNSPGNVLVRRKIRALSVDTLKYLHTCGLYDRIIVVAHSQGTVIAYDMLRAYFSQICNDLPSPQLLGETCKWIDQFESKADDGEGRKEKLRFFARKTVDDIASIAAAAKAKDTSGREPPDTLPKAWLVTDFVTLGSPLTHAQYLMCQGQSADELHNDFARRVREREIPTCPPAKLDNDGLLSFHNPRTGRQEFHHGAVFGLTRWTNLYFPLSELLWGDAIGGPLNPLFGAHVRDVKVSKYDPPKNSFFAHNLYWNVKKGRNVPQIVALRKAVDLVDADKPTAR